MRIIQSRRHIVLYTSFSVFALAIGAFILYPFLVQSNFSTQQVLMHLVSGGLFVTVGIYGTWISYNMKSNYIEFGDGKFKLRWITDGSEQIRLPKIEEMQGNMDEIKIEKSPGPTKIRIQNRTLILDKRQSNTIKLLELMKNE